MKGTETQHPIAGGVETRKPQDPSNATEAVNLTVDRETGGWSTRLGFERYVPGGSKFQPFHNTGFITSLHVSQALAGGARQAVLFEEGNNLWLTYEATGNVLLRQIRSNRHQPTATEAGSWYTDIGNSGIIITNGVDRPLLVRPWPLGNAADSATTIASAARDFGFTAPPSPIEPYRVEPQPSPTNSSTITGGGALTLSVTAQGGAISSGGKWGLGFAAGPASGDPANEALFGWAVAFISDTGSEGPLSPLASTNWTMPAGSEGWRHAVGLEIPKGPAGTVARKIYRTTNYSPDYVVPPGDTTLFFIGLIRNNVETFYIDPIRTANLTTPAPVIPTGPLPAPRARFSAVYNGSLFLDGGIEDSRTLHFSLPGLVEQFPANAYLTLSGPGGGITALWGDYTSLLVFRESGIDVVQGTFNEGFRVTTISNSITCRAPHSIATVPGLGVVFLGTDGFYVLTGGLEGGAVAQVVPLTRNMDNLIQRMTQDCLPRAVGTYSAQWREYQCYVPMDGSDRPSMGFVLHLDRLGSDLSPWTTREGFPVGAIKSLYDGTIVFGHNVGASEGGVDPEAGLFVISGRRTLGGSTIADNFVPGPPPTSRYQSAWTSFGDPQIQKAVQYVTLWIQTTGGPVVKLKHLKDYEFVGTAEQEYMAQPPDAADLPILDTVVLDKGGLYSPERLVPLRVSTHGQSAAWFSFSFETIEDLVLVGFEYEITTKGTRVIAGKKA
jgi:hypothetical protein